MIARIFSQVRRGMRCALVIVLLAAAVAGVAGPGQRKIDSLNFVNAEVSTVLKSLADMSGANIVISPNVKGQITVKLRNVTVDEALQVITKMSGLAYGETNGTYIVNTAAAMAESSPISAHEIVRLQVIAPADAIAALKATYKDVIVNELPDKRLVLVADAARLTQAKAFVADIDAAPAMDPGIKFEMLTKTYQVKNLVPSQVKQQLEDEYKGQGLSVKYAPKMIWEQETTDGATAWESSRLIITGPKPALDEALDMLSRIDQDVEMSSQRVAAKRIYASQAIVFLLENFGPKGLSIMTAPMTYAETVTEGVESGAKGMKLSNQIGKMVTRDKNGSLNVSEPIGDFILRGPTEVVNDAMKLLTTIDVGPERVERLYSVRFLKATEVKKQLEEMYGKEGLQIVLAPSGKGATPQVASSEGTSRVTSAATDTKNNLIEITDCTLRGPEPVVARALQTLETWDAEPPQISIGTEIISIDASESMNLGIEWSPTVTVDLDEQPSGDPLQLGRIVRSPINLSATLNALQTKNKAKLINRPATVVRNAQEAMIHVGDTVYFETLAGFTDSGVPIIAAQRIDTGVTLQVRPLISRDGTITLEITTNVTEEPKFRQARSGAELPQFRESKSSTVVQVKDGETLVIGGLMQTVNRVNESAVPVLSKLPLVGNLFRNRNVSPKQTELLIMVTPTVLRSGVQNPANQLMPSEIK